MDARAAQQPAPPSASTSPAPASVTTPATTEPTVRNRPAITHVPSPQKIPKFRGNVLDGKLPAAAGRDLTPLNLLLKPGKAAGIANRIPKKESGVFPPPVHATQ
jgi:hypothetical protein